MSQQKEDFVRSVENAMHYFQGVPAAIVPDNLKSAVIKSNRFKPTINETFADLADHYGTTILPARAYKPRDKSLVEDAVKILFRRIHAHLKETPFYSLAELNQQIWDLLKTHNDSKLTARPYSRQELFLEDEKQNLHRLPEARFEIKYQSHATVIQNGHVPKSRPMDEEWVLDIFEQCKKAKVSFFFKQWGGKNKKATGRLLNGRTYDECQGLWKLKVVLNNPSM